MAGVLRPLFGALVILGIGYAFSTNRRAINWTTIAWGLGIGLFGLAIAGSGRSFIDERPIVVTGLSSGNLRAAMPGALT